jgi:F-type H+-transporting ATPase subunit b
MLNFLSLITLSDTTSNNAPFTPEDFLNKLFPNFWSFLINFLALIVLFVAVYFIAYKPLKKLIKARGDYVEHNLRDSEQAKAINERKAKEADSLIVEAKQNANGIIKKAKQDAVVKADEITSEAKLEASQRQKDADEAIKQAELKSQQAIHEEIVNVALDASKKILSREVNEKDNKRLVDDFVKDVKKSDSEGDKPNE